MRSADKFMLLMLFDKPKIAQPTQCRTLRVHNNYVVPSETTTNLGYTLDYGTRNKLCIFVNESLL